MTIFDFVVASNRKRSPIERGLCVRREVLELTRRLSCPPAECVSEISRVAESDCKSDILAGHVGVAKILDRQLHPEFID
jgi:hypothetical protein